MDLRIKYVDGREIIDSRGNPTVEAQVYLECGVTAAASVPSGASTGVFEAVELRDGDGRYNGKGVLKAVENIKKKISPVLKGINVTEQRTVDRLMIELDGSDNKKNLGANAVLAVSLACAKAASKALAMPLYRYLGGFNSCRLPVPMMNILNGGAHASNNVDIQEFMIMPVGAAAFSKGLMQCCEIYQALGSILKSRGKSTAVGDEGGFAPDLATDKDALLLIMEAVHKAGYNEENTKIALDAASSEWYKDGVYTLPKRGTIADSEQLIDYYESLADEFPIISIEDGLSEHDWNGWQTLTSRLGRKLQLVGDDLFVTNVNRLKKGIKMGAGNSVLVKINQIGTLSETFDTIETAHKAGYTAVISHRSGETEDTTIADIAVAVNSGQIKTGAPCRTERTAKYNRLLRIEQVLSNSAQYGIV